MRAALVVAVVVGCADPEPAPEFRFVLAQREPPGTLAERTFASYDQALEAAPLTVTVTETGSTREISKAPAWCKLHPCLGHVLEERLTLSLNSIWPENVESYTCIGTRGQIDSGLDQVGSGDCRR